MSHNFLKIMFGPRSRALQEIDGSRASHSRMEAQAGDVDVLRDYYAPEAVRGGSATV